jgi:hypothetical protein
LIAEEEIQPKEDEDSALAKVYRKTLGPEAPEFMVITRSIWREDQERAAELERDWGGFGLAVLGPKGDARLEKSRLVLARISESPPASRMDFPIEKGQLDLIRRGRRHDAVVPVDPKIPPAVGDTVTLLEAATDPFGSPVLVPNGEAVSVDLTEVRNQGHKWVGQDLYYIAWDPAPEKKGRKRSARIGVK